MVPCVFCLGPRRVISKLKIQVTRYVDKRTRRGKIYLPNVFVWYGVLIA